MRKRGQTTEAIKARTRAARKPRAVLMTAYFSRPEGFDPPVFDFSGVGRLVRVADDGVEFIRPTAEEMEAVGSELADATPVIYSTAKS